VSVVYVEGHADRTLLELLGIGNDVCVAGGKGKVIRRVAKEPAAVGLVDDDPSAAIPRAMEQFQCLDSFGQIVRLQHPGTGGYLIVICPRLEEWLYARAEASGLDPTQYGLPSDPRGLHRRPRYHRHQGFRKLVSDLVERDPQLQKLRDWIARD